MEFLAKGKRGVVFVDRAKQVVVKQANPRSQANNRLSIEAAFLQKVNRKGIGPRFVSFAEGKLAMRFVEGKRMGDWLAEEDTTKQQIKRVLLSVLDQCVVMDTLGINKQEMTHPYKHILIDTTGKPVMIDFERCRYTEKPKNVTQFVQYLVSRNVAPLLKNKGVVLNRKTLLGLAERYKKERNVAPLKQYLLGV